MKNFSVIFFARIQLIMKQHILENFVYILRSQKEIFSFSFNVTTTYLNVRIILHRSPSLKIPVYAISAVNVFKTSQINNHFENNRVMFHFYPDKFLRIIFRRNHKIILVFHISAHH